MTLISRKGEKMPLMPSEPSAMIMNGSGENILFFYTFSSLSETANDPVKQTALSRKQVCALLYQNTTILPLWGHFYCSIPCHFTLEIKYCAFKGVWEKTAFSQGMQPQSNDFKWAPSGKNLTIPHHGGRWQLKWPEINILTGCLLLIREAKTMLTIKLDSLRYYTISYAIFNNL